MKTFSKRCNNERLRSYDDDRSSSFEYKIPSNNRDDSKSSQEKSNDKRSKSIDSEQDNNESDIY